MQSGELVRNRPDFQNLITLHTDLVLCRGAARPTPLGSGNSQLVRWALALCTEPSILVLKISGGAKLCWCQIFGRPAPSWPLPDLPSELARTMHHRGGVTSLDIALHSATLQEGSDQVSARHSRALDG
jgi:hypothetical protein